MTARSTVRSWLQEHLGDEDYNVDAVVEAACEHFMGQPKFLRSYASETFASFVAELLGQVRRDDRRVVLGADVVTESTFEDRAQDFQDRFVRWKERAASGTFKAVLHMTRPELLEAADQREVQGVESLRRAAVLRGLAKRLKNDREVVEDRWSAQQVRDLYDRLQVPVENALAVG